MSFSTLPKEMLDKILNQTGIPLAQRIRSRAVSRRFRDTLEDGLQQENSLAIRVVNLIDLADIERRSMIERDNSKTQPYDLIIYMSNFTAKKAIALIQRLFPRLTELAINSNSIIVWRKASEIFGPFASTLTSLKVDGYSMNYPAGNSVFRSLGEAINSMHNLSSLSLEHKNASQYDKLSFANHLLPHLATTLARLERFTFAMPISQNEATLIATSLSTRCTHLHLELDHSVATFPFAANLTHLHLSYSNDTILQFVRQLPQLTSLTLHDRNWPYLDTMLSKIRLPFQVTQLTLLGIAYHRPLKPPASKAFTFPSIKGLTLQLEYTSITPNAKDYLQTVAFWFASLTTCALHVPVRYRVHGRYHEEILAIHHSDLPFTVKLIDNL